MKHYELRPNIGEPVYVDTDDPCRHPGHNPPMHIVVTPGYVHIHTCQGCGSRKVIRVPRVTL
jgi:hypothetical protein